MIRPLLVSAAAAAAFLALPTAACAQAFDAVRLGPGTASGGQVGLAAIAGRAYPGADEERLRVLPWVNYRWSNGWFAGVGNGIGYVFPSASPEFQYGVRLTGDFGRKSRRSPVLAGLDDIDASPELGGFFNWNLSRELSLTTSVRYGAGRDHDGLKLDVGAQYGWMLSPSWRAGVGVSAGFGNANIVQDYFGVPADRATADRPAYSPEGGLTELRASVSLGWAINAEWSAFGALSVTSWEGDAGDSPLVRERRPIGGVLGVSRSF